LVLAACARGPLPLPPAVWMEKPPAFKGLASFRLEAPGKRLSGRAVVLSSGKILYAEGFSLWGAPLFSLWFKPSGFYLVSYPEGQAYEVVLDPPCAEWNALWPYLLQGRLPLALKGKLGEGGSIHLGQGYKLTAEGHPPIFKIFYHQRLLFEEKEGEKEYHFKFPLFHANLRLKWKRKGPLTASEKLPPLPPPPYRKLVLKVGELTAVKAD